MKLNELIKILKEDKEDWGNLDVYIENVDNKEIYFHIAPDIGLILSHSGRP